VHLWEKIPLPNPHQTCMQCPHTESVSTSTPSFSSLSSYFSVHSQNVLYKELTTFHRKIVYICVVMICSTSYDHCDKLWKYGIYMRVCMYVCTSMYVCMYVCITYGRVCTHTHTHTHTHMYRVTVFIQFFDRLHITMSG